jgi:hypothetical protein
MFVLEKLEHTGKCPPYRWTRYAMCASRRPLERVRAGLCDFGTFRVVRIPTDAAAPSKQRNAA